MSDAEIAGVVAGYARAAKTATDAGIDGVELHGAHGYLIQQSYSPWGNSRDDRWGEPMRFTREVISATREAIGPDKLVGFRMAELDDHPLSEGGLSVEQLRSIAQDVIATNAVDYLNTSIGAYAPDYAAVAVGSYRTKPGHELQLTHDMRAAIGEAVPVVGVGRILDPWQAETALRSGDCDLVAMTRAHIADPDLVAKTTRGEAHRIRRCVGANECVDRKMAGLPAITCFHNPDVGREALGPVMLAERRQRVFVVGAGPGGLAAALTAARRGHDVTLVDRADGIGGQLAILRTTAASELLGAVDYLAAELAIFGVTPQLNVHVTPTWPRAFQPMWSC